MSVANNLSHINLDDLVKSKIPALSGKGSENNRLILEYIALNGPQLKYRIFKNLEARGLDRYSTVSRRVDALTKSGYLAEALQIATERGKQTKESGYGLTLRGFVAGLSIKTVRENIFQALDRNPLLTFPEKDSVLVILEEIFSQHDLEAISELLLEAYLKVIPNIELIKDENLWMYLLAIREFPPGLKDLKPSKMPEDAWNLLDRPAVFRIVKEKLVPFVRQKKIEIDTMYILWASLDKLADFISKLKIEDKPSERIKEYLEKELPETLPESERTNQTDISQGEKS